MYKKESVSVSPSVKSDVESAFHLDGNRNLVSLSKSKPIPMSMPMSMSMSMSISPTSTVLNNEFNNYAALFSPGASKTEIEDSKINLKNAILNGFTEDKYTNFNTSDFNQSNKPRLKRFSYSHGQKIKSLSEGECDSEKDYKFNDGLAFYETGDITNFYSDKIQTQCNELAYVSLENPKFKINKFSDIQEKHNSNDFINEHTHNVNYIESIGHRDIDKNNNYLVEDEEDVDYLGIVANNKIPQNCISSSSGVNIEPISCRDNVKNVELKHNECSLTNDFFETIENINIKILEKNNNFKEAVEHLMEVVHKSDFENRIYALIKKSEENSEIIEQFKKKSEDCIRQCRKFETTSENLIGECINTLAQATVCYAEWVSLHSYDLKQIDTDLSDIDLFIKNTSQ